MRAGPIDHGTLMERREKLFTPEPRLGWVFRDPFRFFHPFTEPVPQRQEMPEYLARRVADTERLVRRRMGRTLPPSITAAVVLALFSGCAQSDYALARTPIPAGSLLLALIAVLPGGVLTLVARQQHKAAKDAYELAFRQTVGGYEDAINARRERLRAHESAEHARLNGLPEWGPVPRPAAEPDDRHGFLTSIALDSQARNVRSELLMDLIVQWVTARVAASPEPRPAVVIAAADDRRPGPPPLFSGRS